MIFFSAEKPLKPLVLLQTGLKTTALQNRSSLKFRKFHMKIPELESLFWSNGLQFY